MSVVGWASLSYRGMVMDSNEGARYLAPSLTPILAFFARRRSGSFRLRLRLALSRG